MNDTGWRLRAAKAVRCGVYDFTSYSTLRQWPFVLTLTDVAWGAAASAAAVAVRSVVR
jgi:uncharacterized membrane protein